MKPYYSYPVSPSYGLMEPRIEPVSLVSTKSMRSAACGHPPGELEINDAYTLPEPFLPFLAMDCVNTRNVIRNSRSSPKMPVEIVENEKVNFRSHINYIILCPHWA